jgi:outer membrane protein, heavy metal efflux system
MNHPRNLTALCVALTLLTAGCAPVQHYRPMPLSPVQTASRLEARTLADPGLKSFTESSLGHSLAWPPEVWTLRTLTLAAFYFNPRLAVARARVETAQARIVTVGMRPNPVLQLSPGVPNPYLLGLSLAYPIVTAGKREYQIELAKNLTQVAKLNLAEAVWKVRSGVRTALLDYLIAEHHFNLTQSREQLWTTRVRRLSAQLTAGEIPRPQVETARTALLNARLTASAAQGQLLQARATIATAIGVPISGLESARFAWPNLPQGPSMTTLSIHQIERDAVLNRLDVRRALAEFSAAQSSLRLEIARQHPNFQFGPGYQYEETDNFFVPLLSLPLPVRNRNQGPIAQARARRREAAANLVATQANVIAQSEQAFARYYAARSELETAQAALETLRRVRVPLARQAVKVGETDWLALNSVLLEQSTAAQAWLNAIFGVQAALGELEDAVQKPLEPADTTPIILRARTGGKP